MPRRYKRSETDFLKLKKHDNPETNTEKFDIENYLNGNWDKINENAKKVNTDILNINSKNKEQDTNIEQLQENTETSSNKIAELEKELKEAQEDFYQNSIRGQVSGEYIHVEDSSNCRARIGIGGNSEQETREGYNQFKIQSNATSNNGVTITKNNDSSVTYSGTTTGSFWHELANYNSLKITKKMYIKNYGSLTNANLIMQVIRNGATSTSYIPLGPDSTLDVGDTLINVYAQQTTTGKAVSGTLDILLTDYENKDKGYEQYGAMPSLDYPSKIETVGDNLNLLDIDKNTYDLTINLQKEGEYLKGNNVSAIIIGTFNDSRPQIEEKFKSGNYTISYEVEANSNVTILNLFLCVIYEDDTQENVGSGKSYSLEEGTKQKVFWTLNVQKNVKKMGIVSYLSNSCDIIVSKVKIEKGLIATPYSPYGMGSVEIKISNNDNTQSQTAIMPTQAEMLENDYFDYDNEEEVHVWGNVIVNGTETINKNSNSEFFSITKSMSQFDTSVNAIKQSISNYGAGTTLGLGSGNTNNKYSFNASTIYLDCYNSNINTVEKLKAQLTENNMKIYAKLATPQRIAFTDEQKAVAKELNNARTYKNVTNITTDSIAILSLDYAKDLETLLNNTQALAVNNASEGV